jgi:DNA-binding NarL/FixJ family response regulator
MWQSIYLIIRYNTFMDSRDSANVFQTQHLTPREEEILALIGVRRSNRQIAESLTLTHSTMKRKDHVDIYRKAI